MILVLSSANDAHADHVEDRLRARGVAFHRFDPAGFPSRARVSISYPRAGRRRTELELDGGVIDLDAVGSIWYRRPGAPVAASSIADPTFRSFVAKESAALVQDLWSSLSCRWLPAPPARVREAGHKVTQLSLAGRLGFELPPTLVTNDPDALFDFYRAHGGRIISKMVGHSFQDSFSNGFIRYTEGVSRRDLAAARSLSLCPMIFQAYVEKAVELRVTVVDHAVFAAEIDSQATHHTRHDWRRYDLSQTPHRTHRLPAELSRRCVDLVRQLGLVYGAIDLILTPEGRYVFLEINPNGQYLWIEQATGLPITDAICDYLADEPVSLRGAV